MGHRPSPDGYWPLRMTIDRRGMESMAQPIAVSKVHRAVGLSEGLSDFSTEEMYREILSRLGEDPSRDGLVSTPSRVEK